MVSEKEKIQYMQERREAKIRDHLSQYAPVWLVDETMRFEDDAIQFNAVFLHPRYGWVSRRYMFDSYNNVLYHKGQVSYAEEDAYELQNTAPYIESDEFNTVNSYGG